MIESRRKSENTLFSVSAITLSPVLSQFSVVGGELLQCFEDSQRLLELTQEFLTQDAVVLILTMTYETCQEWVFVNASKKAPSREP